MALHLATRQQYINAIYYFHHAPIMKAQFFVNTFADISRYSLLFSTVTEPTE